MAQPDFLGIGMERAGTSWLFTMLASHPDIWVPPLKELHFWDVIDPQTCKYKPRYSYHLAARLKHKAAPLLRLETRPELYLNSYAEYLRWDRRYFTGRQNIEWYQRLFDPVFTGGRLCGEITPYYANLSRDMIRNIERMNPAMKYMLMIRNPLERAWSALVYHFVQIEKRDFNGVSEEEMLAWLKTPMAQSPSDLSGILEVWQNSVPDQRLFIGAFEDITRAPEVLIKRVYEFLGVDPDYLPPESLYASKINARTKPDYQMPSRVRDVIESKYA